MNEILAIRIGHRMLVVGQDVLDVPANRLRRLQNELQPILRRPEVPPFPEFPACREVDVMPASTLRLFDGARPPDFQLPAHQCSELLAPPLRNVLLAIEPVA